MLSMLSMLSLSLSHILCICVRGRSFAATMSDAVAGTNNGYQKQDDELDSQQAFERYGVSHKKLNILHAKHLSRRHSRLYSGRNATLLYKVSVTLVVENWCSWKV